MEDNNSIDKTDWSNEVVLEFIQLYESYPVLWDPKHRNHKNRNHLNDAWENIRKEVSIQANVETLRKKKESLMSTYRTLIKKVRNSTTTGSGAQDVYEPTWFAFRAIDRFISATTKKIPSLSSDSEEPHNSSGVLSEDDISQVEEIVGNEEDVGQDNDDPSIRDMNQDREFALPQCPPKKRKGGPTQVESSVAKHLKQASDVLTSIATKSQTRKDSLQDAAGLYGQLLAAKLRRLPKRSQLVLQNKIDNLVFEAELDAIDGDSSASSPAPSSATGRNNDYVNSPGSPNLPLRIPPILPLRNPSILKFHFRMKSIPNSPMGQY